jgi:hypothetical protein
MQLIEDIPHQLVYHQNLKTRPLNLTVEDGCSLYPYLLMPAVVPAIVTLLLAHRLPSVFVVIVLGVAGVWSLLMVWQYYESWKLQIREKWLIVDKTTRQLVHRSVFNNNNITENTYTAAQILALRPLDSSPRYWLFLKYESQQERASLWLAWWDTPTERDAALQAIQAALNLPIQTQDADKDKGI